MKEIAFGTASTAADQGQLLISFSGGAGRHLYVGGLFKAVGRAGAAIKVELVYVHPSHPMVDVPVTKWVAGLRAGPGGHYLDPHMVREWIREPAEYDKLIEGQLQTHRIKKLLPRIESLTQRRFKSEYRRLRAAIRPLVPAEDPVDFGLPGTSWTLVPYRLRTLLNAPVPAPSTAEGVPSAHVDMLISALGALERPMCSVRVESLEGHCTVEWMSGQFQPGPFFYLSEFSRGVYRLKKTMNGTCVNGARLDSFRRRIRIEAATARECANAHFEYLQRIQEVLRDVRKTGRLIAVNRTALDALRLLPR